MPPGRTPRWPRRTTAPHQSRWDALAAAGYELGEAARRMQALYDRLVPNARPDAQKEAAP